MARRKGHRGGKKMHGKAAMDSPYHAFMGKGRGKGRGKRRK